MAPDSVYDGLAWLTRHGLVGTAGATGRAALRQLLPAALDREHGPALAAGVEAGGADADSVSGVGDRNFRPGHEGAAAVEPTAELLDDAQVADTELLPAVGPSLRPLQTEIGGASRMAQRDRGLRHGADDTPSIGYGREPTLLQVLGSEEAVLAALADAFDAVEVGAGDRP